MDTADLISKLHAVLSNTDIKNDSLEVIEAKATSPFKFDTDFPSFCFALPSGADKAQLMGAMIAYLVKEKDYRDFLIFTPEETIYTKLKNGEFNLVTGENYESASSSNQLFDPAKFNIYIFNIQKIFNEKTDVQFRFPQHQKTSGSSFIDILKAKNDLVILMDESHRYRGKKLWKALHYINPMLGLEFTATPKSNNIIYSHGKGGELKAISLGEKVGDYLFRGVMYLLYGKRAGETMTEKATRLGAIFIVAIGLIMVISFLKNPISRKSKYKGRPVSTYPTRPGPSSRPAPPVRR